MDESARIGRYETVRLLGRGGMGAVYLARDPLIDRLVAVKVLPAGFDAAARQRFTREARAAGRLHHENIATIFDVGEHGDAPFIAMEYVPGDTLGALIRRPSHLDLTERLRLIEEACAGLAFAHHAGIVHLDVKPENLMRREDGRLKILDFGIARVTDADQTHTRHLLGTLRYMSPEQLRNGPVDARTDVFAVGCVLYEVISRTPAFTGSITEIVSRIEGRDLIPLSQLVPGVHPELERMVSRALAHDPADRYQDLGTLGRELGNLRATIDADSALVTRDMASLAPPRADTSRSARSERRPADAAPAPPAISRPATSRLRSWAAVGLLVLILAALALWRAWPLASPPNQASRESTPDAGRSDASEPATLPPPAATPPVSTESPAARERELAEARESLRGADRAATLKLLRERPYLAVALIDELTSVARLEADEAKRAADAKGTTIRASAEYRAGLRDLERATSLASSGQRIESLSALWQASDRFARAVSPPTAAARTTSPDGGASTPGSVTTGATATPGPPGTGGRVPSDSAAAPPTGAAMSTAPPPPPLAPAAPAPANASPPRPADVPAERLPTAREIPNQPSPEEAVRAALFTYAAAYELRDINAIRRSFPGLSADQASALARTFADAVSYRLQIRVLDVQVSGPAAVATCNVVHELVPKIGSPSRNALQTRFHLRQNEGAWVIQRVEPGRR